MVTTKEPCEVKGCPCIATLGKLCAAHASNATQVPRSKTKPPVTCVRCGDEILQGHWQKRTSEGATHAGYQCEPKHQQKQ